MKKWNLIIDVAKCIDCNNCFLACKDEYVGNDWPGYAVSQPLHGQRWTDTLRNERGQCPMIDVAYLPITCMHCDDAPCISAAKNGAVYKRKDGIVIIDPEKAKGQKHLTETCPYKAIWWNEEKKVPQKCIFDAHLLDKGWREPRCVQSCPTGAMRSLKVEDLEMARISKDENLDILHPEYQTKPRIYYKNLHRFLNCFIGGSVAAARGGITDCAEGARVMLMSGPNKIGEVLTDNYGDFKFDNLEKNSGKYTIEINYTGYERKTLDVDLKLSCNVGTILLSQVQKPLLGISKTENL